MKLNFKKEGGLLKPTVESGELVEDVQKCTVSTSVERETVMTITVAIKVKETNQHERSDS